MEHVRRWLLRLREPWINWRARRLADPVRRLRYLRRATVFPPLPDRAPKLLLVLTSMAAGAALLIPGHPGLLLREVAPPPPPAQLVVQQAAAQQSDVWLVDSREGQFENYSNGLRVETAGTVAYLPRSWRRMMRPSLAQAELRADPIGIIYHTTESHIAPFDPDHTARLKRVGQWLIDYLRKERSYHYLIDRFGRVHRIVRESDAAGHAGRSVWADDSSVYINLNHEFLGVAFESATRSGDGPPIPSPPPRSAPPAPSLRCSAPATASPPSTASPTLRSPSTPSTTASATTPTGPPTSRSSNWDCPITISFRSPPWKSSASATTRTSLTPPADACGKVCCSLKSAFARRRAPKE
ncbi:MAG: N-acetylmuramoyl-L-alanine amidase [Bryobacterales bacterium]|nr:N-acetylmuramoyl-L-alanine amidase [Bryobacterales bacterium]